jgi:hypothetical protein
MMSRNQILQRAACFKCGMRLNKLKCQYGCTDAELKGKRLEALRVFRNIRAAKKRPAVFQIR